MDSQNRAVERLSLWLGSGLAHEPPKAYVDKCILFYFEASCRMVVDIPVTLGGPHMLGGTGRLRAP